MADATKLPSLTFFQWSRPGSPNPKLASPIDADDTTIIFTSAPQDEDGNVITGNFLFGVRNSDSYVETIYVPAGGMSVDGLTATGCVRGIDISGTDYNTGDAAFTSSFDQDSPVFCNITAVWAMMVRDVLQGTGDIATGGLSLVLGDETDSTVTIKRAKNGAVEGFLRLNDSTGKVQYQNSPAGTWVDFDSVTASNLVEVSGTDTTPGYLGVKINAGDGLDQSVGSGGGNETVDLAVDVTDIIDTAAGLTETGNDIQINLDTDPGLEFNAGALRAKVKSGGGITRDSDGLSITDIVYPLTTGVAHEAISQGDAICELPMEVQYYTGLTDADLDLGDANSRRRYAVSLVPKENASLTGTWINRIRGKKFGTGQDLVLRVETDNGGEPSGTLVDANATATVTAASFATSHSDETVTWGGSFSLTKGTQYWLVFQVASTDGTNYLSLSVNSSHDENYLAFERLTYDLDLATWGNSVTNACPWFWNTSSLAVLGFGLVPCHSTYGNKTWNFVGIADNAYSAEADVTYYHEVVPVDDLGLSLTAGLNHYISTSGDLTTTITAYDFDDEANLTYNYRIGKTFKDANGATILKIAPANKKMYMYVESGSTDESHVIQTWFNNPMIRVVVAAASGNALGMGIGFGSSSTEMAGAKEGASYQVDTIYGITSGDNIRISSVTDKTATIIVDETGAATIKAVIELEQI
jgi:hypothetical protein